GLGAKSGRLFRQFCQPVQALIGAEEGTTCAINAASTIDRLESVLDSGRVLDQVVIGAKPVTQLLLLIIPFVDGLDLSEAKQPGKSLRVFIIGFVSRSDQFVVSGLTDGHRSDQRLEQFIKPGGPTAFFKHDVRCAAQATKKIANDRCIGFDFRMGDDLSLFVENDDDGHQLMYIHTDILDILDDTHRTLLCSELICNQMLCHRVSQWGVLSYSVRGPAPALKRFRRFRVISLPPIGFYLHTLQLYRNDLTLGRDRRFRYQGGPIGDDLFDLRAPAAES